MAVSPAHACLPWRVHGLSAGGCADILLRGGLQLRLADHAGRGMVQLCLCPARPVLPAGSEEHLHSGHHHGAGIHGAGFADFAGAVLHQAPAQSVSDRVFPALCDQYAGGGAGFHGAVQEDRLFGRAGQPAHYGVRRGVGGLHRRSVLGKDAGHVPVYRLGRHALQGADSDKRPCVC